MKVGDVVTLKSGSPQMTIQEIGNWEAVAVYDDTEYPEDQAKCFWFDGNQQRDGIFKIASLKITEQ